MKENIHKKVFFIVFVCELKEIIIREVNFWKKVFVSNWIETVQVVNNNIIVRESKNEKEQRKSNKFQYQINLWWNLFDGAK